MAVSKRKRVGVLATMLQAHNLLHKINFLIFHDLLVRCFTHIQQLSPQWEDAVLITSNNTQSFTQLNSESTN